MITQSSLERMFQLASELLATMDPSGVGQRRGRSTIASERPDRPSR